MDAESDLASKIIVRDKSRGYTGEVVKWTLESIALRLEYIFSRHYRSIPFWLTARYTIATIRLYSTIFSSPILKSLSHLDGVIALETTV